MFEFLGHLHSLFVHLPIGLWILFLLLEIFQDTAYQSQLQKISKTILIIGIFSAFLSLLSGYIQSKNEVYSSETLTYHQWIGYATTLIFIGFYIFLEEIRLYRTVKNIFIVLSTAFVLLTVFFGTSLTHGETFLRLSINPNDNSTDTKSDDNNRPPIDKADPNVLLQLQQMGWVITPTSTHSNYLRAVIFNHEDSISNYLIQLNQIKQHIVELKLSYTTVNDSTMNLIENFSSLEKLWLDHTHLTSRSLPVLKKLDKLSYINLFATPISENEIKDFGFAKSIYVVHPIFRDTLTNVASDSLFNFSPNR